MPAEKRTKRAGSDKKRRANLNLYPIRPELRDTFYEFIFKDISEELFEKLKVYKKSDNILYKVDLENPENMIKIVEVDEDKLCAHKNFIMGFMTKILPLQPTIKINIKNKGEVESTIDIPLLPPSMYKILRYDGTCLLNTKYVMKKKDKIFQKKELSNIDKQIFKYWDDIISAGEIPNLSECIEKLSEYVLELEDASSESEVDQTQSSTLENTDTPQV